MLFTAAILATAAAVAPPRIELDLSAMSNAYKLASSVVRSHDLGYKQIRVGVDRCPANLTVRRVAGVIVLTVSRAAGH